VFLPSAATERAAVEVRAVAAQMASALDELTRLGGWSGADARSFRARWSVEVTEPLEAAAAALDGIELDEVPSLLGALFHV